MKKRLVVIVSVLLFVVMSFSACGSASGGGENEQGDKVAVGISWQEDINTDEHGEDLMAYVNCVEKAGGEAVLLDLVKDQEEAKEALADCDALIMTGGEDVNPALYGEEPDPNLEEVNDERDTSDFAMLQEAIDEDMPILCTCRGMQVLNVLQGGSLYQDLPTSDKFKDSDVQHRDPAQEEFTWHDLKVEEGSLLADVVGDTTLKHANSWHHQGVKDVGKDLTVTATSEDGNVEALQLDGASYLVAVQFHPEWHVEYGDEEFMVFFEDLIKHAK